MRAILPQAKMLLDAGVFYPSAAVVDGWAASNTFHAENKPVLARIVRAWIEANDMLLARTNESLGIVHDKYHPNVPARDIKEQFGATRVFPTAVWRRPYGTITEWLQQVTDFYARATKIQNPVPAAQYFDPSIFLSVAKG
jgi:NitT/TauT family transport system substrate-binding protein